ncbi:MAG TPA: helicase-related protein [Prosthecobacter sp.]|jgi:superfamily II DNA or RNA helicase|nr:helicase-related protein [Prosthecobacter sp.]
MSLAIAEFSPGALVRARGREWVVQPGSSPEALSLRPLGGSEDDIALILPDLELTPPEPATFPLPNPSRHGSHQAATLLRDAIHLKLRNGAGPFRSFGNIAVEPRAYQLVPLLMALRLPVVRLLIADDVGIGKTIEAGLIVRELLDRGEITRCAILCPPHLVDQWQGELENRFHIRAVALTSASANRVERSLPPGVSLFDQHPFVVVSLDYIKSERHREHFLSIAPECIIVDEAHTCAAVGQGKQLRFELLQKLAANEDRHLILLTATPHSGDNDAFYNLLSLLRTEFTALRDDKDQRGNLRDELARHFVQRRRKDIEEWQDTSVFPRRFTTEITYALTGAWGAFFDDVRDYCVSLATRAEQTQGQHAQMIWYATLALLRCISSSPAAAAKALETRLSGTAASEAAADSESSDDDERLYDGAGAELTQSDIEPAAAMDDEAGKLKTLIATAHLLAGAKGDPKLAALITHLRSLLKDGFRPVVFCRYIATARYVAHHLAAEFKDATVEAVTGEYPSEEREERVNLLGEAEQPILVATDCLSEGVNLQHLFTAVVHYDLAWNPSRHEQREGRVDRFGQQAREVRATMLYGQDNPVDGFILNVILRKAEAIRKELGVLVPMPADAQRINQALIKAALLKRNRTVNYQTEFDLGDLTSDPELATLDTHWRDSMENAKANRTVFAQRRLRPEEVLPEWEKQRALLGGSEDILRFVQNTCSRLNSALEPFKRIAYRLLPQHLPQALRERLASEDITKPIAIYFDPKAPVPGARFIQRTHPIVSLLADTLLEDSLSGSAHPLAARSAATVTTAVSIVTSIFVLRLRHQLISRRRDVTRTLMAEECVTLAVSGRTSPQWLPESDLARLLAAEPASNLDESAATREIQLALDFLTSQISHIESLAHSRAAALLTDHRRVREAAKDIGSYEVTPCLPVDVLGVYVLLPAGI